jgi:hypothetical protein
VSDEVVAKFTGRTFGETAVVDVQASEGILHGRTHVYLDLVLTDPPGGGDTWPADDMRALRWHTYAVAKSLDGSRCLCSILVRVRPSIEGVSPPIRHRKNERFWPEMAKQQSRAG